MSADQPDAPDSDSESGAESDAEKETGPDAVRAALHRARAAARARGLRPGAPPAPALSRFELAARRRRADQTTRSGARPDARDPQLVTSALDRLVTERGWQAPVAIGGVMGRWAAVVGSEVAAHCTPETFTDGVLAVRADSTAWATQVRLLVPTLMRRLAEEVGAGTVTKVVVRAPSAPSWRRGPRLAPGSQGPRDTYG